MLSPNEYPAPLWLMNILLHFGIYSFINLVPGVSPWDYLGKEEAMGRGCSWSFIFLRWLYLLGKWPQAWHDSEFWERTRQMLIGKWWLIITQQTCCKNRAEEHRHTSWTHPSCRCSLPGKPAEISINQHEMHCEFSPSLKLQMRNVTAAWFWQWLMPLKCVLGLF